MLINDLAKVVAYLKYICYTIDIDTPKNMTAVEYATPENFQAWREEAKTMTTDALMHTIQDCRTAEKAMRGWNPVKEGFYSDQAATYGMELSKRNGSR